MFEKEGGSIEIRDWSLSWSHGSVNKVKALHKYCPHKSTKSTTPPSSRTGGLSFSEQAVEYLITQMRPWRLMPIESGPYTQLRRCRALFHRGCRYVPRTLFILFFLSFDFCPQTYIPRVTSPSSTHSTRSPESISTRPLNLFIKCSCVALTNYVGCMQEARILASF